MIEPAQNRAYRRAIAGGLLVSTFFWILLLAVFAAVHSRFYESEHCGAVKPLLDSGANRRALAVARLARDKRPFDLDARYFYARALMANGKTDAALNELERLVRTTRAPNPAASADAAGKIPDTIPTQRPFFHANARIELGKHFFNNGDVGRAISNFELARGYGQLIAAEWRPLLCDAYGAFGDWDRVFEYDGLNSQSVPAMSTSVLLAAARWAEPKGRWEDCEMAAQRLLEIEPNNPEAYFWLGRAWLARRNLPSATEMLRRAEQAGHLDTAYFLGQAYEEVGDVSSAVRQFRGVSPASLYWPFAAAQAIQLMGKERSEGVDSAPAEALRDFFRREWPIPGSSWIHATGARPLGFLFDRNGGSGNGPRRVLVCWAYDHSDADASGWALQELGPDHLVLALGDRMVELRVVESMTPYGAFDGIPVLPDGPPGWFDLYPREKGGAVFKMQEVDGGESLRTECYDEKGIACCGTPFLPVGQATRYLLAVRSKSDGAKLVAGWRWYNERDEEVYQHNVFNQEYVPEWQWRTEYIELPEAAAYVQAIVGVYRDRGAALFDEVLIFPLDPPMPLSEG